MAHWSDPFVGQAYVRDVADCAVWCERAVRAATGRDLVLPKERAGTWRGYTRQILDNLGRFVEPSTTTAPEDADLVLMIGRGRLNHIGVLCVIGAERLVLHGSGSAGQVVRQRLRDLPKFGLQVEGIYRWR